MASCLKQGLLFGYDSPPHFALPQWPGNVTTPGRVLYTIYRSILGLFLFSYFIILWVDGEELFLLYLTNWGFTLVTVHFVTAAICTLFYNVKHFKAHKTLTAEVNENMPWYFKLQWFAFDISSSVALTITGLYWSALYTGDDISANNFVAHAINTLVVLMDLVISAMPVKPLHFIYPLCLGIIYSLFTVIYWAAGGLNNNGDNYIYPLLDYTGNPGSAAMWICIAAVAVCVLHTFLWGLYKLRVYIFSKTSPQVYPVTGENDTEMKNKTDEPLA